MHDLEIMKYDPPPDISPLVTIALRSMGKRDQLQFARIQKEKQRSVSIRVHSFLPYLNERTVRIASVSAMRKIKPTPNTPAWPIPPTFAFWLRNTRV